jgi:hypothetical protein
MQWSDTVNNTGILQEILRSLKEPSTDIGHWSFVDLLRRANIVMRTICEQTECLRLTDTSNSSISGTATYNKPTGCARITRVAYGNTRLYGILSSELDINALQDNTAWQTLTGDCSRYIDNQSTITIVPKPNSTGTTITIEYIAQPTELTVATSIPFNALTSLYSFHELIISGVVYKCLLEDKNQFYIPYLTEYKEGMKRLRDFVKNMPDTMMNTVQVGSSSGRNIFPLPLGRGF